MINKVFFISCAVLSILFTQQSLASRSCSELFAESLKSNLDRVAFKQFNFSDFLLNGFRNSSFYDYFKKDVNSVRTIYKRWYKDHQSQIDRQFNSSLKVLGPQRISLILDPGINFRLNEFLPFAKRIIEETPDITSINLRQAFSDHVGFITLYRGITYDSQHIDSYISKGLPSMFYDYTSGIAKTNHHNHLLMREFFMEGPIQDIIQRVYSSSGRTAMHSLSQSYSQNIELAKSFTKAEDPGRHHQGYLFEVKIPRLETLQEKDFQGFILNLFRKLTPLQANNQWFYGGANGLEVFVFGRIEPQWLKRVIPTEVPADLQK